MPYKILSLTIIAASVMACGARAGENQFAQEIEVLARQVRPEVERAVGLEFKYPPAIAVRTREEVHAYLMSKMAADFPEEEIHNITVTYRLFGLIPEDLDLQALILDVYTEQVAGYYDPATDSLYVVAGSDPEQVKVIVAHELVHALQAQYVELDSIISVRGSNDRRVAAQAVFEGQGLLASLVALSPGQDFSAVPDYWSQFREAVRQSQESMPVFSSAPLYIRESLIFPYLGGAEFLRWFNEEYPDEVPFHRLMPQSTEQVLHTDKFLEREEPVELRFVRPEGILYEDNMGEFDTQVFLTELSGNESTGAAAARGWGGDRYGLFETDDGYALVWWSTWDTEQAARRFRTVLEREWATRDRPGRAHRVEAKNLGGHPAVLFINAPAGWAGIDRPPEVVIAPSR